MDTNPEMGACPFFMKKIEEVKPQYIPIKCPVCNGHTTVNYGKEKCKACEGLGFIKVPVREEHEPAC